GSEVANQKNNSMTKILQLPHLVQHHGMAQMDVWRSGIQPQLDAQRRAAGMAAGQLGCELGFNQKFVAAPFGYAQMLLYFRGNWCFSGRHNGALSGDIQKNARKIRLNTLA